MKPIIRTTLLLLALLLPATATAYDFEVDDIYYNIINGNEASVTYNEKEGTDYWNHYSYSGDVTIPSTVTYNGTTYSVTSVGEFAFYGCNGLTSVTIPNSVTYIGPWAFTDCRGLMSVTIPNSVTSIGLEAFDATPWYNNQPDGLVYAGLVVYKYKGTMPEGTSITMREGTLGISDGAFFGCSGLTSVTIPNSVTSIGYEAFCVCSSLTSVTIGNSVTSIGERAFTGCTGLTSVTIPNSVITIGREAFSGCSGLTSVNIPNSVTSIGWYAFYGCSGLTSLTIPNSVTFIGSYAFADCIGLTSVTCLAVTPPTIGSNYYYAFPSEVSSQATLYVLNESVSAYQSAYNWKNFSNILAIPNDFEVDGVWYRALDENTVMVIQRPGEEDYYQGDMVIPESVIYEDQTFTVVSIDAGAFEDCYDLTSVVIGDAVESIGENAFQGCTALTSVTIGSGVTAIASKAFNYCNALQTVTCLGMVPPVMASTNCFTNATYNRAALRLPRPVMDAYTAADYWYKFVNVAGFGSSGPGDVNGDGVMNIADVSELIDYLLGHSGGEFYEEGADVNGNGIVNIADIAELIDMLLRH